MLSDSWLRTVSLAVIFVVSAAAPAAADGSLSALKAALSKSAGHAARWLDERDYKSLAQSTGNLSLLAELLKAKGDQEAWQAAVGDVIRKGQALQAAARDEDHPQCQAALAAVERAIAALDKLQPTGKTLPLPKTAIRPLMLTLDSIQADAKIALLTGNAAAAKSQAAVLAELASLVAQSRASAGWADLAADFQASCQSAANSPEAEAKIIRSHFRAIAERCEACHENSRQR